MRKKLSLFMVAFVAIAAFAVQQVTRRAAEPVTITWDFSEFTEQVTLAGDNYEYEYNGLTLVGNPNPDYTNDYVNSSVGFRPNGASSATQRHIKYTPEFDGTLTVTYRSNNSSATDRIVAIGTVVSTFNDINDKPETVLACDYTEGGTAKTIQAKLTAGTTYYMFNAAGGCRITKVEYTYTPIEVATLDFNSLAATDIPWSMRGGNDQNANAAIMGYTIIDEAQGVKMTISESTGNTANRFWVANTTQLRVYGGTLTFESLDETKFIHKLTFNNGKWNEGNTADKGKFDGSVWTGEAKKVVVTVAGNTQLNSIVAEVGEEQKFYLIGGADGAAWTLNEMPELKWNAEADAFEASVQFETEKAYYAISNVASAEDWDSFNANNRFAIAEGDQDAAIGEAIQLQKVNGTIVITGAGKYNLSLTRDLMLTISKAQKYYITGTFNNWALTNMPEMTWNDETKAYEYVLTVAEETNFAISDVATVEGDNAFIAFNDHRYVLSNDDEDAKIGEAMPLALGKGSLILKEKGKYLLSLTEDMQLTISKIYEDIALSVSAGEDISEAIAKEAEGKFVGGITLKLGAEQYTISKPIEPAGSLTIEGNGAVIDASKLEGPFVQMAAEPGVEEISSYFRVSNVTITDVTVKGLKNSIFYDNNTKYCVVGFNIANSIFELNTEATKNQAFISFQSGGAKDFCMKNSTVYQKAESENNYFLRYNNSSRLDRYGFDKETETQSICYMNNTFYNVGQKGQWGNYNGFAGQKYTEFHVTNNIWYNSGNGQISRRILGGRNASSYNICEFNDNTYWFNGAAETGNTQYDTGEQIVAEPIFADAENGDFTLGDCVQKLFFIGDPRWNNTTFGATAKLYNYLEEPQKGSMKVSVLGEDTELTEYGQSADVNSGKTVIVEIAPAEGYLTKDVYLRQSPFGPIPPTPLKVNDNKYAFAMTTSLAFVCVDFLTVLKDEWIGQIANQQWTGEAIEPSLVVVDANTGVQLEADKHYEVSYANNVDAGEATVTITGIEKNGYAGTATAKFNIIKIASTELAEGNFIYRTDDNVTATILWMSANKGATTFEIPATIDGYQIVEIVDDAMQSIDGLKEINMPEGAPILVSDKAFTPTYIHPSKTPVVNVTLENLDDYADMLPMFTKNYKVKATVKQTAEKFWTFSSRTAVLLPEGLKANIVKYKNDNEVEKVALGTQYVEAGQGVLLEGTQDTEYVITAVNEIPAAEAKNAANYEENLLIAVPAAFHFPAGEGYYILKNGEFFAVADTETEVPANKAVLHIVTGTPAAVIAIAGGEATGINTLAIDAQEGNWYDLNGRKLEGKPSQKGIYILNGKKVVLK